MIACPARRAGAALVRWLRRRPRPPRHRALWLWRDTAAAAAFAYAPGIHQRAVKAQRDGGWFPESWFARFAIDGGRGSWAGVTSAELLATGAPATS